MFSLKSGFWATCRAQARSARKVGCEPTVEPFVCWTFLTVRRTARPSLIPRLIFGARKISGYGIKSCLPLPEHSARAWCSSAPHPPPSRFSCRAAQDLPDGHTSAPFESRCVARISLGSRVQVIGYPCSLVAQWINTLFDLYQLCAINRETLASAFESSCCAKKKCYLYYGVISRSQHIDLVDFALAAAEVLPEKQ